MKTTPRTPFDPQKLVNSQSPNVDESADTMFEQLMASTSTSPAPTSASIRPILESTRKPPDFPSLIILPKSWEYSENMESNEVLDRGEVTATPLKQYPEPWRTRSPPDNVYKPALPVMGYVETRVEAPSIPVYPVIVPGQSAEKVNTNHNAEAVIPPMTIPPGKGDAVAVTLPHSSNPTSNNIGNTGTFVLPNPVYLGANTNGHSVASNLPNAFYLSTNNNGNSGTVNLPMAVHGNNNGNVEVATLPNPVYLSTNKNINSGTVTVLNPDYLGANKTNIEKITLAKPVYLTAGSETNSLPVPTQNPEWVEHGLRAFQQVMQQNQLTTTDTPLVIKIITRPDENSAEQSEAPEPFGTQNTENPIIKVFPEGTSLPAAQLTSAEMEGGPALNKKTVRFLERNS
ncbi:unnamed protein product [Strongylus vulgaris]|uniref:Uncharacterized protein n=1 Tax=Strongylus vulgaris TaxID=40348 RepID=A0A3P7KL92_STRVU|nr:unnamed protein product [Strongylus vulgaris]